VKHETHNHWTVLLVEDEPVIRSLIRNVLKRCQCDVLEAGSGEEALTLCEQHDGPIHLLVADLKLSGILGSEVATRVRALRPDVRVLHISGSPYLGSEPIIYKPFKVPELIGKVLELLQGNDSTLKSLRDWAAIQLKEPVAMHLPQPVRGDAGAQLPEPADVLQDPAP